MKAVQLTEYQVLEKIRDLLVNCDADTLAGIFEHCFGGQMTTEDGEVYTWHPDEETYIYG